MNWKLYIKVRSKRNVYGKNQMDGQVSNDLSVFLYRYFFRTNYAPFACFVMYYVLFRKVVAVKQTSDLWSVTAIWINFSKMNYNP